MKYLVRINPVLENQSSIIQHLSRLLGPKEAAKVKELVKNGGIVQHDLERTAADNVAIMLRGLGAAVEVIPVTSVNQKEEYKVVLLSTEGGKLAVIKEVREITGLGLKEAKELVDNLGVIGTYVREEDANNVRKKIENAGAKVGVEKTHKADPEPDIPSPEPSHPLGEDGFIVFGQVKSTDDNPVEGFAIRAWDRGLRTEELLGETVTDAKGNYTISYTREGIGTSKKGTADLMLSVFNSVGTRIADSEIYFNAAREQQIDLVIPAENVIRPSQYEVLVDEITPRLDGAKIAELTNEDIWFLAKKSGFPLDHIAFMADDARLAEQTGIPTSIFWGLAVHGKGVLLSEKPEKTPSGSFQIPAVDLPALLEIPLEDLLRSVEMIINEGLVSSALKDQLDPIKKRFEELKSSNPQESAGARRKRVKALGKIAGLSEIKAAELASRFNELANDDMFWDDLVKVGVVDKRETEALKLTVGLSELTGNNVMLTEIIKKKSVTASGVPVSSINELAVLEQKDWENILAENEISPPAGTTLVEYATQLAQRIEDDYPTEVFFHRIIPQKQEEIGVHLEKVNKLLVGNRGLISRGVISTTSIIEDDNIDYGDLKPGEVEELKSSVLTLTHLARTFRHLGLAGVLDGDNPPAQKVKELNTRIRDLETFFKNNKDKDLRTANITPSDGEAPEITFESIDSNRQTQVKKQVLAYQRTLNIAQKSDQARLLLQCGFDSAHSITKESLASFSSALGASTVEVAPLYHNAVALADFSDLITGTLIPFVTDTAIYTEAENKNGNLINELKKIDGYEDLFGSQSWCDCEDCRSIFGPTAYFVDLMRFVEEKVLHATPGLTGHPIDLKKRRPDLWRLKLTCDNTTKLVSNLTIVNEILSRYISDVESIFPAGSDATIDEIDSAVFSLLRNGSRSFSQPVNIPFAELQLYLSKFDISLDQIERVISGKTFQGGLKKLGFPAEVIEVLTTRVGDAGTIKRRYGLELHDNLAEIELKKIMQVTKLDRGQVERVVKANFINGGNLPFIHIEQREVDGEMQPVEEYVLHANVDRLDRLHRFTRFWRQTAWSFEELDYIIGVLARLGADGNLDRDMLYRLTDVMHLQESLSLSVSELCSILEQIPDVSLQPGQRSHFDSLFNNPLINGPSLAASYRFWHPPYDQESTEAATDPALPLLLGALKIDQKEFDRLMFYLRSSLTPAKLEVDVNGIPTWRTYVELNRRRLTLLYKHTLVAGKLGLSIDGLFHAMALTQQQIPSLLVGGNELKRLLEFLNWQKQTALDIGKLAFVIKSRSIAANNPFMIGEESIRKLQGYLISESDQSPEKHLSALLAEFFEISELDLGPIIKLTPDKFYAGGTNAVLNNDFAKRFASADTPEEIKNMDEFLQSVAGINYIFESLGLGNAERQFIAANPMIFGIDSQEANPMSLESVRRIFFYRKASQANEPMTTMLNNLLVSQLLDSGYNNLDEDERSKVVEMLSSITGAESNYLATFLSVLEPSDQQTGSQFDLIDRLMAILKLADTTGLNGYTLKGLLSDDYDELSNTGRSLKAAIRSTVNSEEDYENLFSGYRDQINELKRDALVDYILTRPDLQFTDSTDIFNFFLIDAKMQGCGLTSRIVEATGALQLYLNRCQLNLEKSDDVKVNSSQIPGVEWEWRKNYRVWEANRKVFLYAENYIRPELRDNKSPEFKKLEERVYEGNLDEQTVEKIYRSYLDGFDDVSSLSIVGSYFDPVVEGSGDGTLYLIGRSQSQPVQHFMRSLELGSNYWSFWEKIEVDINSKAVSPIVFLNRLYLFWIETETRPEYLDRNGNKYFIGYIHTMSLKFVTQNAEGIWSAPQTVVFPDSALNSFTKVSDIKPRYSSGDIQMGTFPDRPEHQRAVYPIHSEPVDHYTLDARLYNRIFPFVTNGKLFFGYGEESTVYEIQFPSNRAVPTSGNARTTQDLGSFYNNSSNWINLQGGSSIRVGTLRMGLVNHHFERPDLLGTNLVYLYLVRESFSSNHHYKDAEKLQTETFEHHPSAPILCRLPASSILQPVNNHPHLYIVENNEGSAILQRTGEMRVHMINLQTRVSRDLKEILFREGLDKMLSLETQIELRESRVVNSLSDSSEIFEYLTVGSPWVFPLLDHSFREYIWEIFFHAPYLIAEKLSSEGKYSEAESWYRYIFNPTADDVPFANEKDQYLFPKDSNWRFREFHRREMTNLSDIFDGGSPAYQAYRADPFNPHAVARTRVSAYQKAIVMAYVNNLISWGDHLFRIDSRESIGEATLVYVMAANILGKRPPETGACKMPDENFITYEGLDISDEFIIHLENLALSTYRSVNLASASSKLMGGSMAGTRLVPLRMEYPVFCVPRNNDLLDYWDRLADRLYKIRHCMNIDGFRRTLALFQPPIDPALLVRAKAAGLSLSDVLDIHAAGLPAYRFGFLLSKARDYCGVVKSFGSALLSALEKKDIEELQLLRSLQLYNLRKMATNIKEQQVDVAREELARLDTRRELLNYKLDYFENKEFMNGWEITSHIIAGTALASHTTATILSALAPPLKTLPDLQIGASGLGGHMVTVHGGKKMGGKAQAAAQVLRDVTTGFNMSAGMASTMGSFKRREEEWNYQKGMAKKELKLLEKEMISAEIRLAIAERSLEIHQTEMEQAAEVYDYFKSKLTGLGLYSWLSSELQKVYRQSYIMALEISQLAQNAYRFERPDDNTLFIQPGFWENSRAGILAGEKLVLALMQMEKTYMETNYRKNEIDQAFSLTQINPAALLLLKQTGTCEFSIPEVFFDFFYPGQYRRKIQSVRLTIPSITGPYTNVSATLSLQASQMRMSPKSGDAVLKEVPTSSTTVISTSTAQNDAGVFQLDFRDDRYMPFEGAGAISSWKLSLPKNFRQFDYHTINDIIIHISYTAEYDELFRDEVEESNGEIETLLLSDASPMRRVISLRQEFSNAFHRLTAQAENQPVLIKVENKHFPLFTNGKNLKVTKAKLVLVTPVGQTVAGIKINVNTVSQTGFTKDPDLGDLFSKDLDGLFDGGILKDHNIFIESGGDLAPDAPAVGQVSAIDTEKLEDIVLYLEYKLG